MKDIDGNVASRLTMVANLMGAAISIAEPSGPPVPPEPDGSVGTRAYSLTTFGELDRRSTSIARGLMKRGVGPGDRMVMLVPFGGEFIRLVFAIMKTGASVVLIDPGIDRRHLIECLAESRPSGFVGISKAQAIRTLLRRRFPDATKNVTVGRRWFWGGRTIGQIESAGERSNQALPRRERSDPAAVIFTTGSTGPPKGVLYTHGTFHAQIDRIRERYDIHRGSRDLACFPLFGLFDAVMGVTTIIPDMDPTRPADVDPMRLIEAAEQWEVDQAFGSPALWRTVTEWSAGQPGSVSKFATSHKTVHSNGETGEPDAEGRAGGLAGDRPLGSIRRVLSAGAPVPAETLAKLRTMVHPDADIHTPYGATEALPIASIESRQILAHTGPAAAKGKGVCVGHRFEGAHWRVIAIDDGPIATLDATKPLATGKIGELIVSGPMVTKEYVVRSDQNAFHKIVDGETVWHRMGDVGYLDEEDRFWFCGRKMHRVTNGKRNWFTIPCEAIFNEHPEVRRSALVGLGDRGQQTPAIVAEIRPDLPAVEEARLLEELVDLGCRNPITRRIERIHLRREPLPVDVRHNSKIFRERIRVPC